MPDLHIVILAAGKGTRMKSAVAKVLHRVAGRPMIEHVMDAARRLAPASMTIVVGHMAAEVEAACAAWPGVRCVRQDPQLGTGHALAQAEPVLANATGRVLVLSGDVPLIRTPTLARLVDAQSTSGAAAVLLAADVDRPYGYGRIIRSHGRVVRVVEERDASAEERKIREVNAGVYALAIAPLFAALREIAPVNAQGEYYLPDLVAVYARQQRPVETVRVDDPGEVRGINSRNELAEVSRIVRQKKNEELMAAGVTLEDPATAYVEAAVEVGPDTVVHPGVHLEGRTRIGQGCELRPGVRIVDSTLGDRVVVLDHSVITGAEIASDSRVGPFAHLRPGTVLRERTHVGNFVEMKNTVFGPGSKANHLTYLGDATVGAGVNVGAGTITCNYDGAQKHRTIIEDGAFVGSDSQLVAPVRVGRGAYVAAGSSITEDVPDGALGVARGRQVNVEGWVEKRGKTRS